MCTYKSYCWSMGTTSFRTADFNQKIERQLTLLSKFWEVHTDAVWSGNDEIQSLYYGFMKDNDFLTGDAPNKPKDAREKTSGLIDLGLTNEDRLPPENHCDKSPPTEISDRIICCKFRPIATFISNRCSKRATT